ncbi:MAG: DUF4124 domain-containing protein [Woeseiaceae bacterium]
MNGKRLLVLFAAFALTMGSGAMANEIYKWTDEQGNVHYGDRPLGNDDAEVVALTYKRANPGAAKSGAAAHDELKASLQEKRDARAEEKATAEKQAAEAEAKQKRCDTYRARLETMVQSRRLYREDADGERVYLDDDQRNAARGKVEDLIAENCN